VVDTISDERKEALKYLYKQSNYSPFWRFLGKTQRNSKSTDITILIKGTDDEIGLEYERRKLAIDFFRGLEKSGVGKLIVGRRGKHTRFEWQYQFRDVMQLIETIIGEEQNSSKEQGELVKNAYKLPSEAEAKPIDFPYKYPLRENYIISINLPLNLTENEADRLCAFIKALSHKE
jgi:hypothetical protein